LNQNKQSSAQFQPASMQANVLDSSLEQAPETEVMDLSASGIQSQPTTGPLDSLLLTFVLTSMAIFFFGIYRFSRL